MQTIEEKSAAAACWSCSAPLGHARLLCEACGKVQPPAAATNYFEVFGLPRHLVIDTAALEKSFYRLSRRLHPDVFARATEQEQQWSLANSSLLNDAYRTLKAPLSRVEYLLTLEGAKLGEADAAARNARVPADLLEEVFELNMQLEEMRMNRKMGEDDVQLRGDLEAAKTNFEAQLAAADASLADWFVKWDVALDTADAAGRQAAIDAMVALLDRRGYLRNLVRDVNETLGS